MELTSEQQASVNAVKEKQANVKLIQNERLANNLHDRISFHANELAKSFPELKSHADELIAKSAEAIKPIQDQAQIFREQRSAGVSAKVAELKAKKGKK